MIVGQLRNICRLPQNSWKNLFPIDNYGRSKWTIAAASAVASHNSYPPAPLSLSLFEHRRPSLWPPSPPSVCSPSQKEEEEERSARSINQRSFMKYNNNFSAYSECVHKWFNFKKVNSFLARHNSQSLPSREVYLLSSPHRHVCVATS